MKEAPQIICLTGLKSTGKTQIAKKLAHDFRYRHVCANTLIQEQGISTEGLVSALIQRITQGDGCKQAIIEGFPRNREEALEFETKFHPIQKIINLVCDDEVLLKRLSKSGGHSSETAATLLEAPKKDLSEVLHFYESFGIVRNVQCSKDPDEVYELAKKAMLPQIIFLYGAPKTGKTTVGHQLADKIGYEMLSLSSFYKRYNIRDHLSAVNELISYLKFSSKSFFILDDLIPNRQQYTVFLNQLGVPYRIFYFDASKDEVERNIHNYGSEAEEKADLDRFVHFIENRPSLSQLWKDSSYFVRINAVQPLEDITRDIMWELRPTVLATHYSGEAEEQLVKRLEAEKGWTIYDVEKLIEGHSHRRTPIGRKISSMTESKKPLAPKHKLDALKNSLFTSGVQKALLVNMGKHLDLYESFEHELFPIRMLDVDFGKHRAFVPEDHPRLYFFERGDLLKIGDDRLDLVDARLNKGVNYCIIFGPTSAGKTFISKAIAKLYGFVLIEWEPTLALIKQRYPSEEESVPFSKILKYFKELFAVNSRRTFVFDGFQPEKNFESFISELGPPSVLITLRVEKPILVKRTRAKDGADVNAEVGEEESQKIETAIQKGSAFEKLCDSLTEKYPSTRSRTIDSNGTLDNTMHAIDDIFSKRVLVVHQTTEQANSIVQKSFNTLFKNVCLANDIIYVDVGKLVAKHYHHKASSMHSELRNQYQMKTSKHDKPESPSHYSPTAVLHIINQHLHTSNQEGSEILLMGYPSPLDADQVYPRPSDQLAAVESGLGAVRIVTVISKDEVEVDINDPVMKLEKPAEPVKEKKEGEGEPPAEDKPVEEAKKAEYSIFDHIWSESTGKSKSLGQWYCNLKPGVEKVITFAMQVLLEMKGYDDQSPFERFSEHLQKVRDQRSANVFLQLRRHF